jgi:phytoene dehydrogenase-like protein
LEKWQKAAPNMTRDNIMRTTHETPEGIEIRFPNMRKGAIKHGDYKPIQLGCFRPNQECSSTNTPIEGLYTCGASTYPGGMVLGGSGYIGANKVADDLGVSKWWKPTPDMERYIKTYLA